MGQPLEGAVVTITISNEENKICEICSIVTDTNGRYEFNTCPQGKYKLVVVHENLAPQIVFGETENKSSVTQNVMLLKL